MDKRREKKNEKNVIEKKFSCLQLKNKNISEKKNERKNDEEEGKCVNSRAQMKVTQ